MIELFAKAAEFDREGTPFVIVTLTDSVGSKPQDAGAKMIVTAAGRAVGTVGGGKLEAKAIGHAQSLLSEGADKPVTICWNLQTDVLMTCGGTTTLLFEPFHARPWRIVIFGAGHVSQTVVRTLLLNPLARMLVVDSREEWLNKLPDHPQLKKVLAESAGSMHQSAGELRSTDSVVCMSQGHATDRPVLEAIFRSGLRPRYLGVIGSDAKRKRIVRELVEGGIDSALADQFRCPIGLCTDGRRIGGSTPAEIAISLIAELIVVRDSQ